MIPDSTFINLLKLQKNSWFNNFKL